MKAVDAAGRNWSADSGKGVQLNEWAREGWTYHAKGTFSISSRRTSIDLFLHFYKRNMAIAYFGLRTHSNPLWLHKSKFKIFPSRHGALFCDDNLLSYIERETSRRGAGITPVGYAVEGTREARTVDNKSYR
jgi:hypothetical protein